MEPSDKDKQDDDDDCVNAAKHNLTSLLQRLDVTVGAAHGRRNRYILDGQLCEEAGLLKTYLLAPALTDPKAIAAAEVARDKLMQLKGGLFYKAITVFFTGLSLRTEVDCFFEQHVADKRQIEVLQELLKMVRCYGDSDYDSIPKWTNVHNQFESITATCSTRAMEQNSSYIKEMGGYLERARAATVQAAMAQTGKEATVAAEKVVPILDGLAEGEIADHFQAIHIIEPTGLETIAPQTYVQRVTEQGACSKLLLARLQAKASDIGKLFSHPDEYFSGKIQEAEPLIEDLTDFAKLLDKSSPSFQGLVEKVTQRFSSGLQQYLKRLAKPMRAFIDALNALLNVTIAVEADAARHTIPTGAEAEAVVAVFKAIDGIDDTGGDFADDNCWSRQEALDHAFVASLSAMRLMSSSLPGMLQDSCVELAAGCSVPFTVLALGPLVYKAGRATLLLPDAITGPLLPCENAFMELVQYESFCNSLRVAGITTTAKLCASHCRQLAAVSAVKAKGASEEVRSVMKMMSKLDNAEHRKNISKAIDTDGVVELHAAMKNLRHLEKKL